MIQNQGPRAIGGAWHVAMGGIAAALLSLAMCTAAHAADDVKPETHAYRKVLAAGAKVADLEMAGAGKAAPAEADMKKALDELVAAQNELVAFRTDIGDRLMARSLVYYFGENASGTFETMITKRGKAMVPFLETERKKQLACVERYKRYCLSGKPGMAQRDAVIAQLLRDLKAK